MKYITLIIGLLVVGCGTIPVKELTLEEKVVGTYGANLRWGNYGVVLLENGVVEIYENGKKEEEGFKWKISKDGELYLGNENIYTEVYRINKDGSITAVAVIVKGGKRTDNPKEEQLALEKIKELTAEDKKVVGTYEHKWKVGYSPRAGERAVRTDTAQLKLGEDGYVEWWIAGNDEHGRWSISEDGELRITTHGKGNIYIGKINKDKSITFIAHIKKYFGGANRPEERTDFKSIYTKIK